MPTARSSRISSIPTTVALDAETGKEVWKVKQGDYKNGQTVTVGADGDQGQGHLAASAAASSAFAASSPPTTSRPASRSGGCTAPDPRPRSGSPARSRPGRATSGSGAAARRGAGTATTPSSNLFYYGTGNPGSWNPDQRPGDNKWSMTIFARNPDTGKAKWAYQKTPHDAWDYDGINENVLVDTQRRRADAQGAGQLRPQRFLPTRWIARPANCCMAEPFVGGELGEQHRPEDRPAGRGSREADVRDRRTPRTSARRRWAARTSSRSPSRRRPSLFYVPTNNLCMDYEGVEVKYQAGQPYVGAIVVSQPGPGGNRGEFIAWDPNDRQEGLGHQGRTWRPGAARSPPAATWCSTARWKAG